MKFKTSKPAFRVMTSFIVLKGFLFCVIGTTVEAQTVTIAAQSEKINLDGESLSRTKDFNIVINGITGEVIPVVNSVPQVASKATTSPVAIELTREGINSVVVQYHDSKDPAKTLYSNELRVELDTIGPRLQHAEVVELPAIGTTLLVTFEDGDFASNPPLAGFAIGRKGSKGTFDEPFTPQSTIIDGRTIRLPFASLPPGQYQLVVKGSGELVDLAGNRVGGSGEIGKDLTYLFSVDSTRTFGQHIEFTPYAPPKKQTIPDEGFNPGDFVETRVAQLYYYRDASRVAQIINRNIRSFNQAAVTQAERRAENSRDEADDATDERREKERQAVRAAEQARNAEQQLAQAQQTLSTAQALQNSIKDDEARESQIDIALADPAITPPAKTNLKNELQALTQRKSQNQLEFAKFGGADGITKLATQVAGMQQSVANLRQTELINQDAAHEAEAKEARRRASQFRDEVTAAETDPDTYVAGDINSVDPVTQCSISVIGEGLIQIRGPIKGINKIRTMINQIDSPVGQIKIGVFTVQVNGEQGDRMEKVVGDAEGFIDLSRFLVNQSLHLLRRAIQSEAAVVAEQCQVDGHYQVDRDRRYLYGFFGRDFIDELYEMNSEFLFTENKLLSLHSMDTISFNSAMFILALAKNDVRERIVTRFLESVKTELPDAEYDYRRSNELKPHKTEKHLPPWNRTHLPVANHYHKEDLIFEAVHRNAEQRYHFRNFSAFFDTGFTNPDTMNPMQREFIRMAQIFKARLVAEMEWKQRVLERGLIEDRSNDDEARSDVYRNVHKSALDAFETGLQSVLAAYKKSQAVAVRFASIDYTCTVLEAEYDKLRKEKERLLAKDIGGEPTPENEARYRLKFQENAPRSIRNLLQLATSIRPNWLIRSDNGELDEIVRKLKQIDDNESFLRNADETDLESAYSDLKRILTWNVIHWGEARKQFNAFQAIVQNRDSRPIDVDIQYSKFTESMNTLVESPDGKELAELADSIYQSQKEIESAQANVKRIETFLKETRGPLDHRKLLNHLIDEQEEKFIELVEGTRAHIAVMDQYLKRLSIAMEDDFKVQFYDPAFIRVREAARGRSVNLSQVERTTILTNNRAFAKVDPQATMEFDLPKRQIAIKEAFDAAKALVEDSGALVNDPTFLAAFQMMGGSQQPTTVKNVIPGQSMSTDQQIMGLVPPPPPQASPGSALQSLVPEPSIYKLETGTGFQLRPVMQPDGDSVVYDFDYMYTTNIREPVRADEKHVGRIKRHFVHTAVQTGNFEVREISRYQVALKVSRTSKGVPLLEDIPLVGAIFRPAPSDESSLQQNIILGQTNVYPTLFDLMGLRWAQQVVDLDHTSLLESEHVVRGRQKSMRDFVFGESSRRVDEFLDLQKKEFGSYRPDFYHSQTLSSPHHPQGYSYPNANIDPSGNNYERFDRRPPEMQEPPYDRYRHQPAYPERIAPQGIPQPILPLEDVEVVPLSQWNHGVSQPSVQELRHLKPSNWQGSIDVTLKHGRPQFDRDGPQMSGNATPRLPVPATLYRSSVSEADSTVVPASFEQTEHNRSRAHRLPPVDR